MRSGEGIPRQLRGWADSLQNSEIKGQRYLNDKTRRASQAAREREEILQELRRIQEKNIARTRAIGEDEES